MPLKVTPQRQEDTFWCWAAVSSMISIYYAQEQQVGVALTQCEAASKILGLTCCPSPPPPPACHEQQDLQTALAIIGHFRNRMEPSTDITIVMDEISSGRPLCAAFQFNLGTLHYLLIAGCDPDQMSVSFVDPAVGILSESPYSSFLQNNTGAWAGWIFTK